MFIVELTYEKSLIEVEKYLEEHVEFLDRYYAQKKFICSGRKNPRVGGVILVNGDKKEELEEILKNDPFYREKIAKYNIIEFTPTKYLDEFKVFI